ncbi:DUF2939 domain-containing protein [Brevundimonas lutea]|uniref:DUF2939 domain-containing protein n=1 Tax=Brevundimonas lutea TaxID=2293980 RepID=UPI000F020B85|nr:DUF2939 domain-containing protein [Brevundimonas lutea]
MAKKRVVFGLVGLAVVAFVGVYTVSPVFAARALVADARSGDVEGLERRVDFPAVREDLKAQLQDRLRRELGDDRLSGSLAGLGLLLAPALIDGAVDAVVTPDAIAAIVRTAEAPDPGAAVPAPEAANPSELEDETEVRYSYRDLNTFGARVFDPAEPDQSVDLIMTRQGLFAWRLTRVVLPEA